MSGTAAVGNTFASAVTATGLQLDNNFSTIVAYLNDPTNRNNYAADAGATNTVVLTFAPPVVGGYTAGLGIVWKWAQTNSGGVVVNANGMGNASLVNPDGSALAPGQGVQGSMGAAVHDGTRFISLTGPVPATQAQQQTATISSGVYLTPSNAVFHPSAAKAWAYFAGGTITAAITPLASFNIASVARTGTGTYVITFSNAMSSTAWAALANATWSAGNAPRHIGLLSQSATSCVIVSTDTTGAPDDCQFVHFTGLGTRA